MPRNKTLIRLITLLAVVSGFLTIATSAFAADKERLLYSFCRFNPCPDGLGPGGRLIFDSAGNLYGTTSVGGAYGYGNVFQLTPGANGKWTKKTLHNFNIADGSNPGGDLIFDTAGNLYGTTAQGGDFFTCDGGTAYGCGTVFEMTPSADGKWKERVLHSFGDGKDGFHPAAGLVLDDAGNLYGAASLGGANDSCVIGCGMVFQLTPGKNGNWNEKVLHSFRGIDGYEPNGELVFDAAGNLYGTTYQGGGYNVSCCSDSCGTVFELTPDKNGDWTESVLYHFDFKSGSQPVGGVIFDAAGNLYGTTSDGGAYPCGGGSGCGTAFQLTPGTNGHWKETALHNFGRDKDGASPSASLVLDVAGNLYGTTYAGGSYGQSCGNNTCGTVFELTPGNNGEWNEKVLHSFRGFSSNGHSDGSTPDGGLIFDGAGNLYGAAGTGGAYQGGAVFEITP
jgi:uncharacterized repeat protein (TIGR03803 family)